MTTDPPDQQPIAPLVPPTPTAIVAQDDAEYPFGGRFSLAQWRHAGRYYTLTGKSHHQISSGMIYISVLIVFYMLIRTNGHSIPAILPFFIIAGCATMLWYICLLVFPLPLKLLLVILNLFGTGFLLCAAGMVLIIYQYRPIELYTYLLFFLYGITSLGRAGELFWQYVKLNPAVLPDFDLQRRYSTDLQSLRQSRQDEHYQIIHFIAGYWITPIAWRALLFDDYALILCPRTGATHFIRREEFSISPTSGVGVVMSIHVTINIANEKPLTGTIDPLEYQTYLTWLQGHSAPAAQESPA